MSTTYELDLYRVTVRWLEGGREDEFCFLGRPPLNLKAAAEAIRNFEGGADDSMHQLADELELARLDGGAQVNDSTRFAAVNHLCDNQPVVVEIQAVPFVVVGAPGLKFRPDPDARVVDLGGTPP